MTKGDTHRIERNTAKAGEGYTLKDALCRIKELEAELRESHRRCDVLASELRKVTAHGIEDVED